MSDAEKKTLADLEWEQVEQAVAERCSGPLRDRLVLELLETFEDTERALAESREAWKLLDRGEPLPLEGIGYIEPSLQHLEREGVLEGVALRDIKSSLRAAAALRRFLVPNSTKPVRSCHVHGASGSAHWPSIASRMLSAGTSVTSSVIGVSGSMPWPVGSSR